MVKLEQVSSKFSSLSLFPDFRTDDSSPLLASSPVNPQDEVSPDVQPTSQLSKHQLDEDDAEREDGDVSSPESQDVSPDSQ